MGTQVCIGGRLIRETLSEFRLHALSHIQHAVAIRQDGHLGIGQRQHLKKPLDAHPAKSAADGPAWRPRIASTIASPQRPSLLKTAKNLWFIASPSVRSGLLIEIHQPPQKILQLELILTAQRCVRAHIDPTNLNPRCPPAATRNRKRLRPMSVNATPLAGAHHSPMRWTCKSASSAGP